MKGPTTKKLFLFFLLTVFLLIPIIPSLEKNAGIPMLGDTPTIASGVSNTTIPISSSGFVYWHRNDGYVVQSTGNNQTKVGHDFDYWNEAWRGWYSFDISSLNQSIQVLSVQLKFRVVGKPDECNFSRAQLGFFYQESSPLIYDTKENLFNRLNSGTQLRNGGFFSISPTTMDFPIETDYIDMGLLGAKSLERNIAKGVWSISVVDQFEGQEKEEYDEGLILELTEIVVSYEQNGSTIKVNNPSIDQRYFFDSILEITWNSSYSIPSVSIILYKNGIFLQAIATNITNLNSFNWTIPSSLDILSKYIIGVQDAANASLMGLSVEFEVGKQNYTPTILDFLVIFLAASAVIAIIIGINIYSKRKKHIEQILNENEESSNTSSKPRKSHIICSYCGTENDPESLECRYCGKEFE